MNTIWISIIVFAIFMAGYFAGYVISENVRLKKENKKLKE